MSKKLLYIEDDADIGRWVNEDLTDRGYKVVWLTSGEGALEHMAGTDLVVLDVMLPGLDGFTIGQRLKKDHPDTPIIMLSARTALEDKLHGLLFADDYVSKPFHPDELAARIDVQLRRFGKIAPSFVQLGHLQVHLEHNRLIDTRTNEDIVLTGKQFQIFMFLLRHPNQILTKEQIYESVWGVPYLDGDKTLMVHIRHLREKLERDPGCPEIIETVRGIGYRVRL